MMTRTEAAKEYATIYRKRAFALGRTCNIDAATEFATSDILNMTKHMSDDDAVYLINDETSYLASSLA